MRDERKKINKTFREKKITRICPDPCQNDHIHGNYAQRIIIVFCSPISIYNLEDLIKITHQTLVAITTGGVSSHIVGLGWNTTCKTTEAASVFMAQAFLRNALFP